MRGLFGDVNYCAATTRGDGACALHAAFGAPSPAGVLFLEDARGTVRDMLGQPRVPIMALTATATPSGRDDVCKCLGLRSPAVVSGDNDVRRHAASQSRTPQHRTPPPSMRTTRAHAHAPTRPHAHAPTPPTTPTTPTTRTHTRPTLLTSHA
jgi:hypothetical protein